MKKVLSLVLVLSMILGSFGMAFAATPSDVVGTNYEDAVNVLTELGVVEGYKDGTYKPGNIVTRAEMATLIVKAMGLNDYAVGKSTYTDMNGHWADAYVAYATSLGVLSGYADGTFRPNQTVTYDQAITMLVQALGYKGEYLVGGYPGAYVAQAKTLGILDNVKSGATGANRGDIAVMLFNALPSRFVRYDRDGSLEAVAISGKGEDTVYDTLLRRLGVEETTDFFVVDESDVDTALTNVTPYVGASVKAYMNKDDEIIAISEVESVFLTGEFDDDTFSADDVDYTLSKEAEGTKDTAATFINGERASLSVADGDTYTIAAKVSGKTIKEVFSVTEWKIREADYFATADADDINEDAELFGYKFYKDDNQEIDTNRFELIGVDSLDDIKKDDVVYVYTGKDSSTGRITRIAVGNTSVSGKVSKVNSSEKKFTVNGTVYSLADETLVTNKPGTGDEVKLILDAYGDIYDIDKISGTEDYAVVLDTADGEKGLNGNDAKIKLFLADGTAKTFVIDSDIENDGVHYTQEIGNDVVIDSSLTAGTIVQYHLDKNGEIDDILVPTQNTRTDKAVTAKGTFDGKVILKSAVIFTFEEDGDPSDEDDYGIGNYDTILDSDTIAEGTYVLDDKEIECIVLTGFSATEDVYGLANGWASIDGDYDYEVSVLVDGASKAYNATSAGRTWAKDNSSSNAAIYKLTFDASGAVKGATEVVTSESDDTTAETASISTETEIDGRYFIVDEDTTYTLADDVIVYKWDDEDEEWTVGRVRDLDGLEASAVVKLYSINGDDTEIYDIVTVVK